MIRGRVEVKAAKAAMKVLKGRKGFDWWWDDLDEDIKQDIRDEMVEAIEKVINEQRKQDNG